MNVHQVMDRFSNEPHSKSSFSSDSRPPPHPLQVLISSYSKEATGSNVTFDEELESLGWCFSKSPCLSDERQRGVCSSDVLGVSKHCREDLEGVLVSKASGKEMAS